MVISADGLFALPRDVDPQQLAMLAINPPTARLSYSVSKLVAELKAIGGDVVVDSPDVSEKIKAAVGQAELRLALDGVSGPATGVLASTLSPRGTLVSFAAMSLSPMSISPLDVIFKPITVRGFFMAHPEFAAKLAPAVVQAAEMIASGRVQIPVAATYGLSSIKEAVAHALRGGKILLDVAGSSN
jgi:NADPH:quinone reductase-like Zn-dependent oxidoreductase